MKKSSTRKLVVAAMLSAVTAILGLTPLGIIPIGPLNATILHLPVIIAAVLEGPLIGLVVGLVFGVFSWYRALGGGSVLAPLFMNPVVSILPRLLIGPVAYCAYVGVQKLLKKDALAIGVSAVCGTLINTIGVMGLIYLLYAKDYAQLMELDVSMVGITILGASAVNGIPECIVAVILVIAVVLAARKVTGGGIRASAKGKRR